MSTKDFFDPARTKTSNNTYARLITASNKMAVDLWQILLENTQEIAKNNPPPIHPIFYGPPFLLPVPPHPPNIPVGESSTKEEANKI